jgi:FkbM family methyltransferase
MSPSGNHHLEPDLAPASFFIPYMKLLANSIGNDYYDNYDARRFGTESGKTCGRRMRDFLRRLLCRSGLITAGSARAAIRSGVDLLAPRLSDIEWLYTRLADQESRQTLVNVMAYRALGHRRVKLPLNNPSYSAAMETIEHMIEATESIELGFMGWRAYKVDLSPLGYPITLFIHPPDIFYQFFAQQYRCQTSDGVIQAEAGEIVLDAGSCYGDTALYFACKTGPSGQVYSFEFLPENLDKFKCNMDLNPEIAERIRLVERPLWSLSHEDLLVKADGPGTRVVSSCMEPAALRVSTLAIDDLVHDQNLERVDLIKMDIEGAELHALRGAEQTLKKFRPKLAIAVYHGLEDFWTIPQYLDELSLGYQFYLRHFTIHAEETVLFARSCLDQFRTAETW